MSRWDIFRWRTLAGGPPCRQGRQRFPHRAFLSPRPKRVPPFGISDGGGTRLCVGAGSPPSFREATFSVRYRSGKALRCFPSFFSG